MVRRPTTPPQYFSSLSENEDNEADEDTKTNENTKTNDDAETDDDTKTNDDTEAVENTDNDKIKSAISVLDRPMRSTVAKKTPKKSLPYHTK